MRLASIPCKVEKWLRRGYTEKVTEALRSRDLLEKIRNGQVKYTRADIDNAVEEYAKNRAKSLGTEEKEKILLKVLLQEAKVTYVNGEWKVVEKPKANKAGVKTGSMIDSIQGQGV